jgi:trans-aconitate methyltransferase
VSSEEQRIAAYYDRLVDTYGHDPRAVDASSNESLRVRYSVLSEVGDMTGKSVLEVGCGFGDLGVFLGTRYERVRYHGIDISRRMIEEGRRLHPALKLDVGTAFGLSTPATYDFVVAQGIFYLLRDDPATRTRELLQQMFALASEAVAVTTLSAWAEAQHPQEFRIEPGAALELGHSLSQSVVLRHDYHPGDLALYVYKRDWQ